MLRALTALDLIRTTKVKSAIQVWGMFDRGHEVDPAWAALAAKVLYHAATNLLAYAEGDDCNPADGVVGTSEEFASLGNWLHYKADQLTGKRPRQLVPQAKSRPRKDPLPDLVGHDGVMVWPPAPGAPFLMPPFADSRMQLVSGGSSTFSDRNASNEAFDARARSGKKGGWL